MSGLFNVPQNFITCARLVRRGLRFIVFLREDRKVQPFADVFTKAALSPQLLKDSECWLGRCFNQRPPAQQTGAYPIELIEGRFKEKKNLGIPYFATSIAGLSLLCYYHLESDCRRSGYVSGPIVFSNFTITRFFLLTSLSGCCPLKLKNSPTKCGNQISSETVPSLEI